MTSSSLFLSGLGRRCSLSSYTSLSSTCRIVRQGGLHSKKIYHDDDTYHRGTIIIRTFAKQADTRNSKDIPKQKKMTKVVPKPKKDSGGGSVMGNESDRTTDLLIRAIDSKPRIETPAPSPQEMKRRFDIGRKYVIGMFQRENAINHDLACKLQFKKHAIQMLPKAKSTLGYLRQEALIVSMEPEFIPPIWRPIPVDTPPIPGFNPSQFIMKENTEEDDDDDDDEDHSLKETQKGTSRDQDKKKK